MYINKALINETAPIEVKKIISESDLAYSKLLEVNSVIDQEHYGNGIYVNRPQVLRGEQRMAQERLKEKLKIIKENQVK